MKQSIKYYLISLLFLLLFLFGCKDNLVSSTGNKSFYPLSVGNTWIYNYVEYDSLGNISFQNTIKETLSKTRNKDGLLVYEIDSPLNPNVSGSFYYTYYLQDLDDGLHNLRSTDPNEGPWEFDRLLYKYPTNLNEKFVNITKSGNRDTTFVVSLNDTVNCEAGIFNCIVYKNIAKNITKVIGYEYTYVAYGVGKIKYESYRVDSKNRFYKAIEYSLKSYKLNQK